MFRVELVLIHIERRILVQRNVRIGATWVLVSFPGKRQQLLETTESRII